jgi:hypothetical protein
LREVWSVVGPLLRGRCVLRCTAGCARDCTGYSSVFLGRVRTTGLFLVLPLQFAAVAAPPLRPHWHWHWRNQASCHATRSRRSKETRLLIIITTVKKSGFGERLSRRLALAWGFL